MDFQQTDDADPLSGPLQACSAIALGLTPRSKLCAVGGTPGVTPVTITMAASTNGSMIGLPFRPGFGRWHSGTHTMRWRVSTANANFSWRRLYFCRVNAAGVSQATIASNLTVNQGMGATGVKTATASQAADSTGDPTDWVYPVLTFQNTAGSQQSLSFIPDQLITTPFRLPQFGLYDWPTLPGILETTLGVNLV